MGQSTTVATAFSAIMLIAGVSILITSTVSGFSIISKGITHQAAMSEVLVKENIAFTSWGLVDSQTLRANVTNTGETSIPLRDFKKMDCIVTFTVSGSSNSIWVPYDQDGDTDSYWKVNRVFFNGEEGDEINKMRLTPPVYGNWDPLEVVEIQIWLNETGPSFEYVTLATPNAVMASTDLNKEYEVGVATVGSGYTYVDVSHSLGRSPVNVQLTPRVQLVATEFWVTNVNASYIRINISGALGYDAPFYWRIE